MREMHYIQSLKDAEGTQTKLGAENGEKSVKEFHGPAKFRYYTLLVAFYKGHIGILTE